jgi:hypothetical protein
MTDARPAPWWASMRAAAVNPSIDHSSRADSKVAGGLFRLVGPDGLEPTSIRAGHTGPVTTFRIRFADSGETDQPFWIQTDHLVW